MKPEVKTKWHTALRSGEYNQHQGCLRTTKGTRSFCCLGVLTDLYVKEHPEWEWEWKAHGSVQGNGMTLAPVVYEWAGLGTTSPTVLYPRSEDDLLHTEHLAVLNDCECYSFEDIATLIETQL